MRIEAYNMAQNKEVQEMLLQEKYDRMDWVSYGNEREKKGIDETRVESIKSVMEGLKYTAQQAMDLLKIPAAEQPKYLARI